MTQRRERALAPLYARYDGMTGLRTPHARTPIMPYAPAWRRAAWRRAAWRRARAAAPWRAVARRGAMMRDAKLGAPAWRGAAPVVERGSAMQRTL